MYPIFVAFKFDILLLQIMRTAHKRKGENIMKYPNSKFTGMSMVTVTTINDAISDYYPNTTQTGGVQRLALLKKATNLDKLIDFCIDGYRAWGDAVLM